MKAIGEWTIRLLDGAYYVFHDSDRGVRVERAQAGPFPDLSAAGWWIVERNEQRMTDGQRQVWGEMIQRAGGLGAEPWAWVYVGNLIQRGSPRERVTKFVATWGRSLKDNREVA